MAAAASSVRRAPLLLAQHKPFSFLSPSTSPKGNKRFAIDLLTGRNSAINSPWVVAQVAEGGRRPSSSAAAAPSTPRDLPGLVCIGRLDADSTGLMLWTTDADLATRVMSPESHIEKEYLVRVTGHEAWSERRRDRVIRELGFGMSIEGVPLKRATVQWLNEAQLQIVLTEGKHRQARTMCDMVGLEVMALKRVRIGGVRLGGLRIGQWSSLPDPLHRMLLAETRGQAPEAQRGAAAASGTGAAPTGAGKGKAAGSEARVPRVKVVQVPRPGKVLNEVVI